MSIFLIAEKKNCKANMEMSLPGKIQETMLTVGKFWRKAISNLASRVFEQTTFPSFEAITTPPVLEKVTHCVKIYEATEKAISFTKWDQ